MPLPSVKSMSLAVGRCVLEKTRWEDWVMHGVKVEDSGLAGGHSVTETVSTGCADEFLTTCLLMTMKMSIVCGEVIPSCVPDSLL